LDDAEFTAFERTARSFLKMIGFTPTGYYPYEHCSNVSGELAPEPPFALPMRCMVEIARGMPTRASVEGFVKLSKAFPAQRLILICQKSLSELAPDLQSLIHESHVEFFDHATISAELEKRTGAATSKT
jgi:hypothetical protein